MRLALILALSCGCAAPSLAQTPATRTQPGTAIAYSLPSTSLKVAIGLTLTRCVGGFTTKADVNLTPSVGPNPHPAYNFVLDGRSLSSFWKNRKISLETYPSGSIKSLNGGVADQTGSIIGSVIKLVASVAMAEGVQPVSLAGQCNVDTIGALDRVTRLTARIATLRDQLAAATPVAAKQIKEAIDASASEVASARTEQLHLDIPYEVVLERNVTGGTILLHRADFAKWLNPGAENPNPPVTDVVIGFCVAEVGDAAPCDADAVRTAERSGPRPGAKPPKPAPIACPDDAECRTTIVLREPRRATITAISLADGITGKPKNAKLAKGQILISQWGELGFVPLRGGFGKSLNFAMGFDENGHKTSETWDATARGATLVGAANSVADATIAAVHGLEGERLAQQKAEIDRLTTLKNYNQARYCAAIYEAGGYTCP